MMRLYKRGRVESARAIELGLGILVSQTEDGLTQLAANIPHFPITDFGARPGAPPARNKAAWDEANTRAAEVGGAVMIPPGVYDTTADLQVLPGVRAVMGAGPGSVLRIAAGNNTMGNHFRLESLEGLLIADFALDGNRWSQLQDDSDTNYGLYLGRCSNIMVRNVWVRHYSGVGIHLFDSASCQVHACHSTGNRYHGMELELARGTDVVGGAYSGNGVNGVYLFEGEREPNPAGPPWGAQYNRIIGVLAENNDNTGFAISQVYHPDDPHISEDNPTANAYNVIVGCVSRYNGDYGMHVYRSDRQTMSNCVVAYNGKFGVVMYQARDCRLEGSMLISNSQDGDAMYAEIMVEGEADGRPSSRNVIAHNTIVIRAESEDGGGDHSVDAPRFAGAPVRRASYAIKEAGLYDGPTIVVGNTVPYPAVHERIATLHPRSIVTANIGYRGDNSGTVSFSGDASRTSFSWPHGLDREPRAVQITAGSYDAGARHHVEVDDQNITVVFDTAPILGDGNIVLRWSAHVHDTEWRTPSPAGPWLVDITELTLTGATLHASPYQAGTGGGAQAETEWQVTTSGDDLFADPVWAGSTHGTTSNVAASWGALPGAVNLLLARARHRSLSAGWGEWGPVRMINLEPLR